jgi:hypothetical protein
MTVNASRLNLTTCAADTAACVSAMAKASEGDTAITVALT